MKRKIETMEDAFEFQLQRLYSLEERIRSEFPEYIPEIRTNSVSKELKEYVEAANSKVLRLERVFSYLMKEPVTDRNESLGRILHEVKEILKRTDSIRLKELLLINVFKDINAYKISGYRNLYLYSVELELDTPSDLLYQILDLEIETGRRLTDVLLKAFNTTNKSVI